MKTQAEKKLAQIVADMISRLSNDGNTVPHDMTIRDAMDIMHSSRRACVFIHMPDGAYALVTMSDVFDKVVMGESTFGDTVASIATRNPTTFTVESSHAAEVVHHFSQFRTLPIIQDGAAKVMVARDMVACVEDMLEFEVDRGNQDVQVTETPRQLRTVARGIDHNRHVVGPNATILETARAIELSGIRHVYIVQDEVCIGIATMSDIVIAYLQETANPQNQITTICGTRPESVVLDHSNMADLFSIFKRRYCSQVPVNGNGGKLIGFVDVQSLMSEVALTFCVEVSRVIAEQMIGQHGA